MSSPAERLALASQAAAAAPASFRSQPLGRRGALPEPGGRRCGEPAGPLRGERTAALTAGESLRLLAEARDRIEACVDRLLEEDEGPEVDESATEDEEEAPVQAEPNRPRAAPSRSFSPAEDGSSSEDGFLQFQKAELRSLDENFDSKVAHLRVTDLLESLRGRERANYAREVHAALEKASFIAQRSSKALDAKNAGLAEEGADMDGLGQDVAQALRNRDKKLIDCMRRLCTKIRTTRRTIEEKRARKNGGGTGSMSVQMGRALSKQMRRQDSAELREKELKNLLWKQRTKGEVDPPSFFALDLLEVISQVQEEILYTQAKAGAAEKGRAQLHEALERVRLELSQEEDHDGEAPLAEAELGVATGAKAGSAEAVEEMLAVMKKQAWEGVVTRLLRDHAVVDSLIKKTSESNKILLEAMMDSSKITSEYAALEEDMERLEAELSAQPTAEQRVEKLKETLRARHARPGKLAKAAEAMVVEEPAEEAAPAADVPPDPQLEALKKIYAEAVKWSQNVDELRSKVPRDIAAAQKRLYLAQQQKADDEALALERLTMRKTAGYKELGELENENIDLEAEEDRLMAEIDKLEAQTKRRVKRLWSKGAPRVSRQFTSARMLGKEQAGAEGGAASRSPSARRSVLKSQTTTLGGASPRVSVAVRRTLTDASVGTRSPSASREGSKAKPRTSTRGRGSKELAEGTKPGSPGGAPQPQSPAGGGDEADRAEQARIAKQLAEQVVSTELEASEMAAGVEAASLEARELEQAIALVQREMAAQEKDSNQALLDAATRRIAAVQAQESAEQVEDTVSASSAASAVSAHAASPAAGRREGPKRPRAGPPRRQRSKALDKARALGRLAGAGGEDASPRPRPPPLAATGAAGSEPPSPAPPPPVCEAALPAAAPAAAAQAAAPQAARGGAAAAAAAAGSPAGRRARPAAAGACAWEISAPISNARLGVLAGAAQLRARLAEELKRAVAAESSGTVATEHVVVEVAGQEDAAGVTLHIVTLVPEDGLPTEEQATAALAAVALSLPSCLDRMNLVRGWSDVLEGPWAQLGRCSEPRRRAVPQYRCEEWRRLFRKMAGDGAHEPAIREAMNLDRVDRALDDQLKASEGQRAEVVAPEKTSHQLLGLGRGTSEEVSAEVVAAVQDVQNLSGAVSEVKSLRLQVDEHSKIVKDLRARLNNKKYIRPKPNPAAAQEVVSLLLQRPPLAAEMVPPAEPENILDPADLFRDVRERLRRSRGAGRVLQ